MKESKILNDLRNGERWNEKKKNAETIANAVRQSRFDRELKDKAVLIANCATNLQFAENIKTGQRKLKNANFCRQRLCPMCQWRLAVRRRINFLKTIENIPSANFLFVTLTVRNCAGDELRETMGLLLNSFYKFYRNRLKMQGRKGFFRLK